MTSEEKVEMQKYLEELVGKYVEYKNQENYYKSLCTEITNSVDESLHFLGENAVQIYVTALGKMYDAKYVDRKTKKVNYTLLAEVLSDELYNQVIEENLSSYLSIRASAAPKSKTRKKPVEEKDDNKKPSGLPQGSLLK